MKGSTSIKFKDLKKAFGQLLLNIFLSNINFEFIKLIVVQLYINKINENSVYKFEYKQHKYYQMSHFYYVNLLESSIKFIPKCFIVSEDVTYRIK